MKIQSKKEPRHYQYFVIISLQYNERPQLFDNVDRILEADYIKPPNLWTSQVDQKFMNFKRKDVTINYDGANNQNT